MLECKLSRAVEAGEERNGVEWSERGWTGRKKRGQRRGAERRGQDGKDWTREKRGEEREERSEKRSAGPRGREEARASTCS